VGPIINVKAAPYNATGLGVADDTLAIQAAITAAAALTPNPGMVYLPPGTYNISASLQAGAGLSLYGAGKNSTFIKAISNVANPMVNVQYNTASSGTSSMAAPQVVGITFQASTANSILNIQYSTYAILGIGEPLVADCTFDLRLNAGGSTVYGLQLVYTWGAQIRGCNVQGIRSYPYTGTSTATTTTTLTATGTPWTANAFIGCIVSSGASTGYITSNTTSALTVSGWNGGTPATGAFTIYQTKFNPYPYDVTVYISGGTVSFIGLGTSNTVYTTALVSGAFRLKPGACIALNYSAAPYWVWVAE
jgi:hypothetical protein